MAQRAGTGNRCKGRLAGALAPARRAAAGAPGLVKGRLPEPQGEHRPALHRGSGGGRRSAASGSGQTPGAALPCPAHLECVILAPLYKVAPRGLEPHEAHGWAWRAGGVAGTTTCRREAACGQRRRWAGPGTRAARAGDIPAPPHSSWGSWGARRRLQAWRQEATAASLCPCAHLEGGCGVRGKRWCVYRAQRRARANASQEGDGGQTLPPSIHCAGLIPARVSLLKRCSAVPPSCRAGEGAASVASRPGASLHAFRAPLSAWAGACIPSCCQPQPGQPRRRACRRAHRLPPPPACSASSKRWAPPLPAEALEGQPCRAGWGGRPCGATSPSARTSTGGSAWWRCRCASGRLRCTTPGACPQLLIVFPTWWRGRAGGQPTAAARMHGSIRRRACRWPPLPPLQPQHH